MYNTLQTPTDFRPRVRRPRPKAVVHITPKQFNTFLLVCLMFAGCLFCYAYGKYQAAVQAQAMVEANR